MVLMRKNEKKRRRAGKANMWLTVPTHVEATAIVAGSQAVHMGPHTLLKVTLII